MFVVLVQFRVKPEFADDFRQRVLQHATNCLTKEPGCQQFDVSQDPDDPTQFMLYEAYVDKGAFDVHVTTEHFGQFANFITDGVVSKQLTCWERCN